MKKSNLTLIALATLAITQHVTAFEQEKILFQFDFAAATPNGPSSNTLLGNKLGEGVAVDDNTPLGLNVAYFLADNNDIEVLAVTSFMHNDDFGVSDLLGQGNQLSEVTHLSPILTANHYFNDISNKFMAYIGADINNPKMFEKEYTSVSTFAGLDALTLVNSFGIAAKVGADYVLNDKWFINGSTRWIDINTAASFNLSDGEDAVEIIEVAPWVYSMALGFRF
jgi:outer membrane protein